MQKTFLDHWAGTVTRPTKPTGGDSNQRRAGQRAGRFSAWRYLEAMMRPKRKDHWIGKPGFPAACPAAGRIRLLCGIALLSVLMLLLTGCTVRPPQEDRITAYGRGQVIRALEPPQPRDSGDRKDNGLASPRKPDPAETFRPGNPPSGRPFELTLRDGSRVGGLFFPHPEGTSPARPLWIAGFGFLQDRWGKAAVRFYRHHLQRPEDRIDAHLLILDHPSTAPFLAANGMLSLGAYDDARMWIEIGRYMQKQQSFRGIHLLGAGVSAQTVIHALVEDLRLELRLFESGIAISPVSDLQRYPARPLGRFETPPDVENPWLTLRGRFLPPDPWEQRQKHLLEDMVENQFLPHYRDINPGHTSFGLPPNEIPIFFRKAFENRLAVLRNRQFQTKPWNEEILLVDLDAFMQSSRIGPLVGWVRTPVVLLHAADDPIVPQSDFRKLGRSAANNPWIIWRLVENGGHAAFESAYGTDYLRNLLEVLQDPDILRNWRAEIYSVNR
jgi:hypothetical protein